MSQIPARVFGFSYLALIPTFAVIYLAFAGEFYHATIRHEAYLHHDEQRILSELRNSMITNFVEANGSQVTVERPDINWDHIYLYELDYSNGYYSFALLADPRGQVTSLPPHPLRIRFALSWARPGQNDTSARMYGMTIDGGGTDSDLMRRLFPVNRRFSDEFQVATVGFLVLPSSLEGELIAWAAARNGFPAAGYRSRWPSFCRMLYLSMITITTVGYGDILPVTTRARLLVGAEAVLGIIVIGLFVNSLAIKAQGRRG